MRLLYCMLFPPPASIKLWLLMTTQGSQTLLMCYLDKLTQCHWERENLTWLFQQTEQKNVIIFPIGINYLEIYSYDLSFNCVRGIMSWKHYDLLIIFKHVEKKWNCLNLSSVFSHLFPSHAQPNQILTILVLGTHKLCIFCNTLI